MPRRLSYLMAQPFRDYRGSNAGYGMVDFAELLALGGKSGTLNIDNFMSLPDGHFGLPRWHRDENEPYGRFCALPSAKALNFSDRISMVEELVEQI